MSFKPFKNLKEFFNKVARNVKHIPAIFVETLKDLRKPKEIGMVIVGAFVPGGFIAYGIYRAAVFRNRRAANDNKPPEAGANNKNTATPEKPAPKKPPAPSLR